MSRKPEPAAPSAVPRETRHTGSDGIAVIMPRARAAGIRAFGPLRPGVEYVVAPDEALRLVRVKGFEYASADDAKRAAVHAAPTAPAEPAAVAAPIED